jgi:hypothetical protein|tara:strand:- start:729 stop:908 length:180 start_codon:yes stop_codon:yes gene_type:complete
MDKLKTLFNSRRFWVGVAAIVVVISDTIVGEGVIDPVMIQNVVILAASWIVGDSIRATE